MRKLSLLAIAAALLLPSCSVLDDALDCVCGPRTGNAKFDSFFTTAEQLETSALRVDDKVLLARADLALSLGELETASDTEINTAYCALFDGITVTPEPPVCEANVDIAVQAAAECDVTVTPGEIEVRCEGTCRGTCRGGCNVDCEFPTIAEYCDGTCYGKCREIWPDIACYGTCYGTCNGNCSVMDGATQCAGSCDGTCDGYCEIDSGLPCAGECTGNCAAALADVDCNAQCNGTCSGHCEGFCEGDVTAPEVDAECQAEIQARAAGEVVCYPPRIVLSSNPGTAEEIAAVTGSMGRLIAATAEVATILDALGNFDDDIQSFGALAASRDLDATQAACAATKIDDLVDAMDTVATSLEAVAGAQALLICP